MQTESAMLWLFALHFMFEHPKALRQPPYSQEREKLNVLMESYLCLLLQLPLLLRAFRLRKRDFRASE